MKRQAAPRGVRLALIAITSFAIGLGAARAGHGGVEVEYGEGESRGGADLTIHVEVPHVRLSGAPDGFTTVEIEGFGAPVRRPGAPHLPRRILRIAIPADARVRVLDVRVRGERFHTGHVPTPVPADIIEVDVPYRALRDAPGGATDSATETGLRVQRSPRLVADPRLYGAADASSVVRLGEYGTLRRQQYVELIVSPVRYDPDRGGLIVPERIDIDLAFDGGVQPDPTVSLEPKFEDVYRAAFVNYAQGSTYRLGDTPADGLSAATAAVDFDGARYRVLVDQHGVVRVDHGLLASTALLAEPISTWKATNRGVEVPLDVHDVNANDLLDPGDWVQFWGQRLDDEPKTVLNTDLSGAVDLWEARDFTDVNTYFIGADAAGPRSRMATRDAAPTNVRVPPDEFVATVRAEVDDAWRPLGSADPWYWEPSLDSGGADSRSDDVSLPGLVAGSRPATVRAHVRGETESSSLFPDHRTRVTLKNTSNQTLASNNDDGTFDGRTLYLHEFGWTYPGSGPQLTDPARVVVEALPASGSDHAVVLDWIEVDYRRAFTALGDALVFSWPDGQAEFVVGGLTSADVRVYELTATVGDGGTVVETVRLDSATVSGAGPFDVRFRIDPIPEVPDGEDRTFAIVGPNGVTVPSGPEFSEDTVSDLRDTTTQADIVVVAHPGVLGGGGALQSLLAYRFAAQGLTSKIADIRDVEDEFNDGLPGPVAIRNFLTWVMSDAPGEGWADPKPTYVLLYGDGSYDYKAGEPAGNYVPTQILFKDDPSIGYYASDNVLAAVVGDDQLADLMVGRIPGRSSAAADVVVDKILAYEQTPAPGAWTRHTLFISDRGKGSDPTYEALEFERLNDEGAKFIDAPPHTIKKLRYFSDFGAGPANPMRQAIKDGINGADEFTGAALAQFVGHGNFVVWSDDAFFDERFSPRDTEDLANGSRLPWLLVHNCLTGGFHTTQPFSMGEDWLNQPGGGALAVLAPSGLGFRFIGEVVIESIFGDLFGPPKVREVGSTVMNAISTLCGQNSIEACQYYVLLGDPASRLQIPSVAPAADLVATAGNGEVSLSWTASATPGVVYDVYRSVSAANGYGTIGTTGSTAFLDVTAVNAETYYYVVVARDGEGFESRWSNFNSDCAIDGPDCAKATPLNPNPPSIPTGVAVVDPESGGRLDVSWNAVPEDDFRAYRVYWGEQPGVYTADSGEVRTSTTYAITGLVNGTTYYVAVTAANTSGLESDFSGEDSGIPNLVLGLRAPGFVDDLVVDRSGSDAVLSWGAVTTDIYGKPETVSLYEVFRGESPDFVPSIANRIAQPTTSSFVDPGALAPGGANYYWLVRAIDTDGNGGGLGKQLPDGVRDLTIAKSISTPGNLDLSWTAVTTTFDGGPTTVDHYDVYGSDTPFTRADIRNGLLSPLTTVTSPGFELNPANQRAYLTVIAVDARGNESPF